MGFQRFYYRISGIQDLIIDLAVPRGRETVGFDGQRIERPTVPVVHPILGISSSEFVALHSHQSDYHLGV